MWGGIGRTVSEGQDGHACSLCSTAINCPPLASPGRCSARARLPAAPTFASIGGATKPVEMLMTPEERMLLDEALGRANAALALARTLTQTLGELGIIPPAHLLDMQDVSALVLEEAMGDQRAMPDLAVQLRETRSTTAMLDDLPLFRAARAARRS